MTTNNINNEDRKSYEKIGLIYNAIIKSKKEIFVKILLKTEGDINYKNSEGSEKVPNLLYITLGTDNRYLNLLLEHGADFTYKNEKGKTIVHIAISAVNDRLKLRVDKKLKSLDLVLAAHVKLNNPSNPSDKYGMTHFHAACMTDNKSAVEFFLNNGVDVNLPINATATRYSSYTPLHLAIKHNCPNAVEALLKHGANMHLKNTDGLTPLHKIIKKRMKGASNNSDNAKIQKIAEVFEKFVIEDEEKSINEVDDYGFTKFHAHCFYIDDSFVASIIKKVANINQPVNFDSPIFPGYTPLHFAAYSNVRMFKLLLRNGADAEAKNAKGQTPLDLCMRTGDIEGIDSILLAKAEWKNIVLSDNETMLVDVVLAMKKIDDFKTLLETASNLLISFDSPLWPGYTLLHLAAIFNVIPKVSRPNKREYPLIDECLKRGADMTVKDAKGATPLHLVFYMENYKLVEYLLNKYDKPDNPADENNWSFLHIACFLGQHKSVEHLLSNGANVNSQVNSTFEKESREGYGKNDFICPGSTPLHIDVAEGHNKVTQILLRYGADVNLQDVNGFTPIHHCLTSSNSSNELLFSVKNLKNITTPQGLSHLHVACAVTNIDAVYRLLKIGADVNAAVTYEVDVKRKHSNRAYHLDPLAFLSKYAGYTPLHFACNSNLSHTTGTAFALIENGADVYVRNSEGTLPLTAWMKYLDESKFDVIYRCTVLQKYLEKEYGITMLHIACQNNNMSLVERLVKKGVDINAKVNSDAPIWKGYTPLHCIVKFACGKYDTNILIDVAKKIVQLLIKHGADVLLTDNNNETPIHFVKYLDAYATGFERKIPGISSVLTMLISNIKDFNVNPVNNHGLSIFHVACLTANMTIIENFLKHDVDVNQMIGYFFKMFPGSTPLHLIIIQYREEYDKFLNSTLSDKAFLKVVDMLLKKGANVNATDASRNTPLHEAVKFVELRQHLMKKFISNGADVHIGNIFGNTAFEDLLLSGDATWKEIELFLNAGASFNGHNPISQMGYLAIFLHHHKEIRSSDVLVENPFVIRILNNPKIIEVNNSGRNMIHNLVSIKWKKEHLRVCPMFIKLFRRAFDLRSSSKTNSEASSSIYEVMIKQLIIRGCDIDYKDNEGKTALHLAVAFRNNRAIICLLKFGADIHLTDKSGKTAFAYCHEPPARDSFPWFHKEIDLDKNYANKLFAFFVHKFVTCKQSVNEQNKQLYENVLEKSGPIKSENLDWFNDEIEKSKKIKIGKTSLSLYEFLTIEDMPLAYINMTIEERKELDEFAENIDKYCFSEIDCLVKWKYRKAIERTRLYEPAARSLNILINYHLPDIINRKTLKFLTNEDLKRLVASV